MEANENLTKLFSKYMLRKLKKGQTLLFQGEVPRYAYVIHTGIIKSYNISSEGEEQIISLSSSFDILPEAWLLGEASIAYYFYEAFTDCELYVVPRQELSGMFQKNPELLIGLAERSMRLNVGAHMHINALEQSKSRDKIIHLLHYLMMRFGEELSEDRSRINFRLTHQTLANMVGLTRETIAIELSRLRKQKVLDYKGQLYTIDKKKLLELRNEEELISTITLKAR